MDLGLLNSASGPILHNGRAAGERPRGARHARPAGGTANGRCRNRIGPRAARHARPAWDRQPTDAVAGAVAEIAVVETPDGHGRLEADFTAVAAAYGARKGITYRAWRELGVEPRVLAAAEIRRGG